MVGRRCPLTGSKGARGDHLYLSLQKWRDKQRMRDTSCPLRPRLPPGLREPLEARGRTKRSLERGHLGNSRCTPTLLSIVTDARSFYQSFYLDLVELHADRAKARPLHDAKHQKSSTATNWSCRAIARLVRRRQTRPHYHAPTGAKDDYQHACRVPRATQWAVYCAEMFSI